MLELYSGKKKQKFSSNSSQVILLILLIYSRNKKAVRLSKDHKATDIDEQKLVEARGGMVLMGKVGGTNSIK